MYKPCIFMPFYTANKQQQRDETNQLNLLVGDYFCFLVWFSNIWVQEIDWNRVTKINQITIKTSSFKSSKLNRLFSLRRSARCCFFFFHFICQLRPPNMKLLFIPLAWLVFFSLYNFANEILINKISAIWLPRKRRKKNVEREATR